MSNWQKNTTNVTGGPNQQSSSALRRTDIDG